MMDRFRNQTLSRLLGAMLILLLGLGAPARQPALVHAQSPAPTTAPGVTADDLIRVANRLRTANGLKALTVNSILMGTAQWTADFMAANDVRGHIGNVRGRVMQAGYGGGEAAWATENIMSGSMNLNAEEVWASAWADDLHMIPAKNPIYCDIGAGVAQAENGDVYLVVHAAYSSSRACGPYIGPGGTTLPGQPTSTPVVLGDERVFPVHTVTPQPDGSMAHVVEPGQSLWSIAIAYGLKIKDILRVNGLADNQTTIYAGQKLLLPLTAAPPQATPSAAATPRPSATAEPNPTRSASPTLLPSPEQSAGDPAAAPNGRMARLSPQARGQLTAILVLLGVGLLLIGAGLAARKKR